MTHHSSNARRSSAPARTFRAAGLLTCAAILATIVAGCTADGSKFSKAPEELPAKNVDQWTMPLDQFMRLPSSNSDYAENLLIEPCMEVSGYEWTIPAHDVAANDGASWNPAGTRLLNPALAAEWGYRLAPANDSSILPLRTFNTKHASMNSAEEQTLNSCVKKARKKLPSLSGSSQIASGYFKAAWDSAKKNPKVVSTTKKWRQCMAPLGIADLSADPEKMPSPSLVQKFNISLEVSPIPPVVSADEIKVAVEDLACQDQSGYRLAFYNAQWAEQVILLEANADVLQRARKENLEHDRAVLKVISAHIPNG